AGAPADQQTVSDRMAECTPHATGYNAVCRSLRQRGRARRPRPISVTLSEVRAMSVNINQLAQSRTSWPAWNQRAKIKRVNAEGKLIPGEFACGGEAVRVSPRYLKNGASFRVRPERPAMFFMFWCHEHGLLPTPLTAEELEADWA